MFGLTTEARLREVEEACESKRWDEANVARRERVRLNEEIDALRGERDKARALLRLFEENLAVAERLIEEGWISIDALRAELATTYVRDAKGRIARHPSAAK